MLFSPAWASIHETDGRLTARSRKVSNWRDSGLDISDRWSLTGASAAALPRCLSNFRAMRSLYHPISRLRDFTRSSSKTSVRLVNRGSGWYSYWHKPLILFFTHQAPQILLQQPLAGRPEARPTRVRYGDSVCRRVCRQYDMKRLLHSLLVFGLRSPATRLLLHFFFNKWPRKTTKKPPRFRITRPLWDKLPVNIPHKGQVIRKAFLVNDVILYSSVTEEGVWNIHDIDARSLCPFCSKHIIIQTICKE